MKNVFRIIFGLFLAILTFSCVKETANEELASQKEPFKLIADVDSEVDVATKTTLDGTTITWSENDAVKAYGIYTYESTSITRSNENRTAEFTFPALEDGDEVHYAIYPSTNAGGTNQSNMTVTIPAIQTATAGSFDPNAMASIGRIVDGNKIAFKNVGALLSIVINNDDISSVEITATESGGGSLTGESAIEISDTEEITTVTDGSSLSVKLTGALTSGETYYFVVYPGEYSNLRIVVTDSDGAIATYRNKTPFVIARNENWKIAELSIPDAKWVPAVVETTYFYESFDKCNGTGGNDNLWNGSAAGSTASDSNYDVSGWASDNSIYKAKKCVKLGTSKINGSITTPELTSIPASSTLSVKFKAGAWDGTSDGTTLNLSVSGGGTISPTSVTMVKGSFKEFEATLTNATTSSKITFGSPNLRFFLDEVKVVGDAPRNDSPNSYSVTYDANSGSGTVPVDETVYNDQSNFIVTVLGQGELTQTGYAFNGWNTAADGSGKPYASGEKFIISNDVILYAQWLPIEYNITKIINDHCIYTVKNGESEVVKATVGTTLTLEAGTPEIGWAFNKFRIDYTKEDSSAGQSNLTVNPKIYTMPASDITITLVLDNVGTYDVTWKVGTETYSEQTLSVGEKLALPSDPDPETYGFTGNTFMGWTSASSVNSDGSGITYAQNGDDVTADVTYHAVFSEGSLTPASLSEISDSYTLTDDDELVIVAKVDESYYGLYQQTTNSTYVKNFEFENNVNSIAKDSKTHWTVSTVSGNKYLGDSTTGYLYTSESNNLAVNTENSSAITLAYNNDKSKWTIKVGGSRYLSLRSDLTGDNKNLWRLGGTGTTTGVAFLTIYKYTPASGSMSNFKLEMP